MKLNAATELFLKSFENPQTRRAYRSGIELLKQIISPDTPVADIKPMQIILVQQAIEARKWTQATKRKAVKSIKTFFNWLVKYEVLEKSPARAVKTKRLPTYVSRDKAMQERELQKVLDYVFFKPRDYALILFLADTGCRAGGASGLRVDDLDLQKQVATVTEKGNKTRPVIFGPKTANAIRGWLNRRGEVKGSYVFSRDGHQIKPSNISQIVRRACLAVGVRSLGSHSLRHRKGHQLADQHVAPSIAATALGHSDPTITLQHYYPADWESAEREMRQLVVSDKDDGKVIRIAK